MKFDIQHDIQNQQFFTIVEEKISVLEYSISSNGKTLDYYRTFVPPELRGQHIGDELVIFALNYAKENGFKVMPSCPFVAAVIKRHPEYKHITA